MKSTEHRYSLVATLLAVAAATQLNGLEEDFLEYFPDMLAHARNWVEK
ncbi:MAG: hypothetical protein QF805_20160 [Pirellulaceae bacterium]|nr:hypothetical protein [Pirellulaceae bacterium]